MNWRILPALIMIWVIPVAAQDVREVWSASAAPGGVVVICNDSVKAGSLSRDDIQEMFLGRKTRWDDGTKVVLAVLRQGEATDLFVKDYVGKTPQQFFLYWDKQVYTGKGRGPDVFASPLDLVEFVKNTPGAIGYVPVDAYKGQVKNISIE